MLQLDDHELKAFYTRNPSKTLTLETPLKELDPFTKVNINPRVVLKLRGWLKNSAGNWIKTQGHPQVSPDVLNGLITSNINNPQVFYGNIKELKIKKPFKWFTLCLSFEFSGKAYLAVFSPLLDGTLSLTTVYPIDQKKLRKLIKKSESVESSERQEIYLRHFCGIN